METCPNALQKAYPFKLIEECTQELVKDSLRSPKFEQFQSSNGLS